jgi:hypothetical protein
MGDPLGKWRAMTGFLRVYKIFSGLKISFIIL